MKDWTASNKQAKQQKRSTSLQRTIRRARKRAKRRRASVDENARFEKVVGVLTELISGQTGSFWVCCEGDATGPDDPYIPSWCAGVKGMRAHLGIWHPAAPVGPGRVLWKRLIYPVSRPSELEMLADARRGGEE